MKIEAQFTMEVESFNRKTKQKKWEDHFENYTTLIANCQENIILLKSEVINPNAVPPPSQIQQAPVIKMPAQERTWKVEIKLLPKCIMMEATIT